MCVRVCVSVLCDGAVCVQYICTYVLIVKSGLKRGMGGSWG